MDNEEVFIKPSKSKKIFLSQVYIIVLTIMDGRNGRYF